MLILLPFLFRPHCALFLTPPPPLFLPAPHPPRRYICVYIFFVGLGLSQIHGSHGGCEQVVRQAAAVAGRTVSATHDVQSHASERCGHRGTLWCVRFMFSLKYDAHNARFAPPLHAPARHPHCFVGW